MKTVFQALLAAAVLSAFLTALPSQARSETEDKTLLKSVVKYEIDYQSGKWEKREKRTFRYTNAYPKTITSHDYESGETRQNTFEYTFRKNNLPQKLKMKDMLYNQNLTVTYNKNGTIAEIHISGSEGQFSALRVFQYAVKNYFTLMVYESTSKYSEGDKTIVEHGDEIDAVSVKTKNGLLRQTVNHGLYANYGTGVKKKWQHFNGTYTANYDDEGILNLTSAVYRAGPSGKESKFSVKRRDGQITQVIKYRWNSTKKGGRGGWDKEEKYVFAFTKTRISAARYASMINAQLMDEYNNYYVYHWY